jgi:hypothetical protein
MAKSGAIFNAPFMSTGPLLAGSLKRVQLLACKQGIDTISNNTHGALSI